MSRDFFVWGCFVALSIGLVIGDYIMEKKKNKENTPKPNNLIQCDVKAILESLELFKIVYFNKKLSDFKLRGIKIILDDEIGKYTNELANEIYESMSINMKMQMYLVMSDAALIADITSSSFKFMLETQQKINI